MFAFELSYSDEISPPSLVVVRRSFVRLGTEPGSHVMLSEDGEKSINIEVRRGLGRSFSIVGISGATPEGAEGLYYDQVELQLAGVRVHILALESDLSLRDGDSVTQGEIRVLRRALRGPMVRFPALHVAGKAEVLFSFAPDQTVIVGRARPATLRIDSPEVSGRHARFGFDGTALWVEDLGSTNGTFVNGNQVAGRATIARGDAVLLGRTISIYGLLEEGDFTRSTRHEGLPAQLLEAPAGLEYPALVAGSSAIRPARFVLKPGLTVQLGRDPSSDIWVGVPQVSRKHCTLFLRAEGTVVLTDHSTNGTQYNGGGLLRRGDSLEIDGKVRVLDFSGGVIVALCFTKEQEQQFLSEKSSSLVMAAASQDSPSTGRARALTEARIDLGDPNSRGAALGTGFGAMAEAVSAPRAASMDLYLFLLYALTAVGAVVVLLIVAVLARPFFF